MEAARVLCFELSRQTFAIPLGSVQEVVPVFPITKVFHTVPCVAGIINLRGRIVAVLDVALLLGLGHASQGKSARLILVGEPPLDAAILADAVRGIRALEGRSEPLASRPGTVGEIMTGVYQTAEGPIVQLDSSRILDAEPLRAFR